MRFWIKWFTIALLSAAFLFAYPFLSTQFWYWRIATLDTPPAKLAERGGETAVAVAEKLLRNKNPGLVFKGLEIARDLGSGRLVPEIIPYIRDSDDTLSEMALKALESVSTPDLVDPLSRIARTADARTRLAILQALAGIETSESLVEALAPFRKDPKWVIRMVLADELGRHSNPAAARILKKMVSDEYLEVAAAAASSLSNMNRKTPFSEIFAKLHPDQSWLSHYRAIRLLTLYPDRIVGILIARLVSSPYPFLAVAAMDWMKAKGDERDFSLVVRETDDKPPGVVKCAALETLAELADRAGKRDATILALMRFLKNPNEELVVAAMHGLGRLKAEIAAETLSQFAADSNLELSAEAIRTLGLIGKSSSLPLILEQIKSEHAVRRTAAYEACLHYETLPGGPWTTSVPRVSSPGEALALGVFLLFHGEEGRSREILLDQYKMAEDRTVRIRLLETLALFHSGITTLDLLKLVRKQDLESWEKSKTVMERCPLRLATPAIVDGFLFYLGRQPRNVQYTMMSFTSASESIWDQQDVLYLKGKGENRGRIQGVILHENYNSYYYAVTEKEVLQVSRRLVAATHYSPLYELFVFQCEQRRFYELFETALEREKWKAAGYVLQKVLVRWTVLNAEILHHPVALRALETIEKKWKGQAKRFRTRLEEEGVVQVADRYVSLQEAAAEQLEKLDPEEARRRRERAEERYREGVDLAERGDYRQAVSRFREALEIWPFHGAALREIGVSFARLGEYEKALDFYERLKKKRKPDPDLQNSISLIYRLMDKPRKALNALTREIELDPSLARGRLDAADVLMELERTEQALELLESGVPLVENPFDLHFKLARIYRKSKENENAIRHMEKALSLKPEDVDALTYMGLLRFAAGDTPRAINALKKAIAFDMANIPARLTLSEIYIGIGDWKAARVELEKILAIDPRNAEARQLIESIDQER